MEAYSVPFDAGQSAIAIEVDEGGVAELREVGEGAVLAAYIFRAFGPPQISVLLPVQTILQDEVDVGMPGFRMLLPQKHSRAYSSPAYVKPF